MSDEPSDAPVGNTKYARYILTKNNPGDWRPTFADTMAFMAWGCETAPTTGTPHIHVYIRFKVRKYWTWVKQQYPDTDIRIARGNEQQCRDYCHKDNGEHGEHGTFDAGAGKQGKRTDLDAVVASIRSGATIREVAERHPTEFLKFHGGIQKMISVLAPQPPTIRQVTVTILWGTTGVGKTHRVRTKYPGGCLIKAGRDPFQSYNNQDVIIFDEFNYEKWSIQDMNLYCDKWQCELDCRYANKHAYWTKVFILANEIPWQWWPLEHQSLREAFWRRITNNIEVINQEQQIDLP